MAGGMMGALFGDEDEEQATRRRVMENAQKSRERGRERQAAGGGPAPMGWLPNPAEQYQMSQGMAQASMDNIRRENDSRVSQNREMRRMAHEQELMRIKTQGDMARAAADRDAMLIRELLSGM
jgi:hypothetical protein